MVCIAKSMIAGPVEATALGNIGLQLVATGEAASLAEVRAIIGFSFPTEVFEPRETEKWSITRNDSGIIARQPVPEIQEMVHLEDLWDDEQARSLGDRPLALLRYRSNLLGADLRITNFGCGNTSSKFTLPDPFDGNPVRVLAMKGSGGDLASINESGFAILYLDRLERLKQLYRGEAYADEMVPYYPLAAFGEDRVAASIDTALHAFLPFDHVDISTRTGP